MAEQPPVPHETGPGLVAGRLDPEHHWIAHPEHPFCLPCRYCN
jgi:hypothetical protein